MENTGSIVLILEIIIIIIYIILWCQWDNVCKGSHMGRTEVVAVVRIYDVQC